MNSMQLKTKNYLWLLYYIVQALKKIPPAFYIPNFESNRKDQKQFVC